MAVLKGEVLFDPFVVEAVHAARSGRGTERMRRLRLVERMERLALDGGGAVSPEGAEWSDAVLPAGEAQ